MGMSSSFLMMYRHVICNLLHALPLLEDVDLRECLVSARFYDGIDFGAIATAPLPDIIHMPHLVTIKLFGVHPDFIDRLRAPQLQRYRYDRSRYRAALSSHQGSHQDVVYEQSQRRDAAADSACSILCIMCSIITHVIQHPFILEANTNW